MPINQTPHESHDLLRDRRKDTPQKRGFSFERGNLCVFLLFSFIVKNILESEDEFEDAVESLEEILVEPVVAEDEVIMIH